MNKSRKWIVVGIGELLWDMLPSGRKLGGAPANFAWFAKSLGAETYVVSRVGADRLGADILKKLKKSALSTAYISSDHAHSTGTVEVSLDKSGKPAYDIKRNVAWDYIAMSKGLRALARRTRAVCFGSIAQRSPVSRATIRLFLESVPRSALRIFDVNLRQSFYNAEIIRALLRLSNVLKLNDEELPIVAGLLDIKGSEGEAAGRLMRRYDLRVLALTKGSRGSVIYSREGVCPSPGAKIRVADTVGAGDAFTAGLVMGLLKGWEMKKIAALANLLAVYVCGKRGATPALPSGIVRIIG